MDVLALLIEERERLDRAITALQNHPTTTTQPYKKKRNLSPEGRKRIADAARARWAKMRSASKHKT